MGIWRMAALVGAAWCGLALGRDEPAATSSAPPAPERVGAPAPQASAPPSSPPAAGAPGGSPTPAAAATPDPFAPSGLMRDRARQAGAANGGAPASAPEQLPSLAGVIVKGEVVLACFRMGRSAFIVERGADFQAGGQDFTFLAYDGERARLRDAGGRIYELQVQAAP